MYKEGILKHEEPRLGDVDRSQFSIAEEMIPESSQLFRRFLKGNREKGFCSLMLDVVTRRLGDVIVVVVVSRRCVSPRLFRHELGV